MNVNSLTACRSFRMLWHLSVILFIDDLWKFPSPQPFDAKVPVSDELVVRLILTARDESDLSSRLLVP